MDKDQNSSSLNDQLKKQFQILSVLHNIALATSEKITEDELIKKVTDIVGEALYPIDFGIMLLEEKSRRMIIHHSYRYDKSFPQADIKKGEGITGFVADSGMTVIVGDVTKHKNYIPSGKGIKSEICVPIKLGSKVIGVINSEHTSKNAFDENDEKVLTTIANYIAPAIERIRVEEDTRRRLIELYIIHSISRLCVKEKDEDILIEKVTQIIGETFYPTNFGMMMLDEKNRQLMIHSFYRLWRSGDAKPISIDIGVTGHTAKTGQAILVNDTREIDFYNTSDINTRSELCVPIKIDNRVLGVMNAEHDQVGFFTEKDKTLLITIAGQLGTTIERIRADRKLHYEKERLQITLKSIGEGVIAVDDGGRIVLTNQVTEQLTGLTHSELEGQEVLEALKIRFKSVNNGRIKDFGDWLKQLKKNNHNNQYILSCRDGTNYIIDIYTSPLMSRRLSINGWVFVFRDITDKLRAEEEALKYQKLESVGILAGGLAHDLNNILAAMMGNLDLLKFKLEKLGKEFAQIDNIENAVTRAASLTKRLLTFSKGGAPVKETASVETLLKESVTFMLSGSKVASEFESEKELWTVEIDPGQISQAFNNLVLNAVQAMPEHGIIQVSLKNIEVNTECPAQIEPGKYVYISIRDNGIGIPETNIHKIFDPYFSTKVDGSGLGLATTYSIIKNHSGWIDVESEPGKGTEFKIYLPATMEKSEPVKYHSENISTGSGKILFMDDEASITNFVQKFLTEIGYTVKITKNSEETINEYTAAKESGDPYDIIILDLTIPGGPGGIETVRKLRELDPSLVAIATSGYSDDPVLSDLSCYGFDDKIVKPFKISELAATIGRHIKID